MTCMYNVNLRLHVELCCWFRSTAAANHHFQHTSTSTAVLWCDCEPFTYAHLPVCRVDDVALSDAAAAMGLPHPQWGSSATGKAGLGLGLGLGLTASGEVVEEVIAEHPAKDATALAYTQRGSRVDDPNGRLPLHLAMTESTMNK
jgi:hypothetical protein